MLLLIALLMFVEIVFWEKVKNVIMATKLVVLIAKYHLVGIVLVI
jgi:hypothetical protein